MSNENNLPKLTYAVTQRLRFIDFLVFHYGTMNRSIIMDYFGISQPQASFDIPRYIEIAPRNIAYDNKGKTYRRTNEFKRVWE